MKKTFITTAVILLAAGSAFADEPRGMRTPNGGYEYYTNSGANARQGTLENGCFLHWSYAGFPVLGYNPKRIDMGDRTEFVDCKLPTPVYHKHRHHHRRAEVSVPTPVAPIPAPAPAPVMPVPVEPLPPADTIRE